MAVRRETVNLTSAGSAGSATASGNTTKPVHGLILAVYINYDGSAPGTTDVVIEEANEVPALPVLTVSNANTDGWFYPRVALDAVADGSDIAGPVDYQRVGDHLSVDISGTDDALSFAVTIVWDDLT